MIDNFYTSYIIMGIGRYYKISILGDTFIIT